MLNLNFEDYRDFTIWCEDNKLQFTFIRQEGRNEVYILTNADNIETLVSITYEYIF